MVGVTSAIGELQHTEFLKPLFLYALKWAISPVLSDQVTYCAGQKYITDIKVIFNFTPQHLIN